MNITKAWMVPLVVLLLVATSEPRPAWSQVLKWTQQLGTTDYDSSWSVSADGLGSVYIAGITFGDLGGPNQGDDDVFVSKYDSTGAHQWTRQLGTDYVDAIGSVSADGLGGVYIAGTTEGDLQGPNQGFNDAFITKYDENGVHQWTHQLGTIGNDDGLGVSADGLGAIYLTGTTEGDLVGPNQGGADPFLIKFDSTGKVLWALQPGTYLSEGSISVSADGLNGVYITGTTGDSAGSRQAYVSKYDPTTGLHQWTCYLGTVVDDESFSVSADGLGGIYIAGYTEGSLGGPNQGFEDAFVAKYDTNGNLQWTRQLGTVHRERCLGVSADGLGCVYITGNTEDILPGPCPGYSEAFVAKYDSNGTLLWTRQFDTEISRSYGVSADGLGSVYCTGDTNDNFFGPNQGFFDAFVAKLDGQPPQVIAAHPYHDAFPGSDAEKVDTLVNMIQRGPAAQSALLDNITSSSQGINGVVLDFDQLDDLDDISLEYKVSPMNMFTDPIDLWSGAPAPSSTVLLDDAGQAGSDRVLIKWTSESITNQYLCIKVIYACQTIAELYLGHLRGEMTGASAGVFTVAFADITVVRNDVGLPKTASGRTDVDKTGTVTFQDISATRSNLGSQLTQITVPALP